MNRANKSIGWTDWTWNPIKGVCPVGCWYCYARRIYKRFGMEEYLRFKLPNNADLPRRSSKIFVCSTIELFHPSIPRKWRDAIFLFILHHPQHTFQILTKMPENIDREMPDNVWLGVTVTSYLDYPANINFLREAKARVKFMSIEPLLKYGFPILGKIGIPDWLKWIIIGRLTGSGKKHDPPKEWILDIVNNAKSAKIPIFLKDNLRGIWGDDLIQKFPKEK